MDPKTGEILGGKYRLLGRLGQGGMGVVYEGEHINLRQPVAIKVLLPSYAKDETLCKRFVLEAQAASRIEGEHVVRVFDVDQSPDGTPFLVMEKLDGENYADRLERTGVLTYSAVADALLQAMEALGQAHGLGMVHRDIKPANLFAANLRDGREVVKVLDFGIASAFHGAEGGSLTGQGTILGSLPYMSPEHCKGARFATVQSDVWSLGVTAYELVSGQTPFNATTMAAMFQLILDTDAAPLTTVAPHVPPAFSNVIAKALARDTATRYPSILELARAMTPFASREIASIVIPRIEGAIRTRLATGEYAAARETEHEEDTIARRGREELPQFLDEGTDSNPEPTRLLAQPEAAVELPNFASTGAGSEHSPTARNVMPHEVGPAAAGPHASSAHIGQAAALATSGSNAALYSPPPESRLPPNTPRMASAPAGPNVGFVPPMAGPLAPQSPLRTWLPAIGLGLIAFIAVVLVGVIRLRGRGDPGELPAPEVESASPSAHVGGPPSSSVAVVGMASGPSIVSTSVVVQSESSPSSSSSASSPPSASASSRTPRPRPSAASTPTAKPSGSGWATGRDEF